MQVENEDQSRVIGAFADRYKWQVFNLACVYADETETEQQNGLFKLSALISVMNLKCVLKQCVLIFKPNMTCYYAKITAKTIFPMPFR